MKTTTEIHRNFMKINLNNFLYHKSTKTLTAFISDLNIQQLPSKITIFNTNTKQERNFIFSHTEFREDEIAAWKFKFDNLTLTIFND